MSYSQGQLCQIHLHRLKQFTVLQEYMELLSDIQQICISMSQQQQQESTFYSKKAIRSCLSFCFEPKVISLPLKVLCSVSEI